MGERKEEEFCQISIHALTRSATNNSRNNIDREDISIHALTRSATGGQGR